MQQQIPRGAQRAQEHNQQSHQSKWSTAAMDTPTHAGVQQLSSGQWLGQQPPSSQQVPTQQPSGYWGVRAHGTFKQTLTPEYRYALECFDDVAHVSTWAASQACANQLIQAAQTCRELTEIARLAETFVVRNGPAMPSIVRTFVEVGQQSMQSLEQFGQFPPVGAVLSSVEQAIDSATYLLSMAEHPNRQFEYGMPGMGQEWLPMAQTGQQGWMPQTQLGQKPWMQQRHLRQQGWMPHSQIDQQGWMPQPQIGPQQPQPSDQQLGPSQQPMTGYGNPVSHSHQFGQHPPVGPQRPVPEPTPTRQEIPIR